MIQKLLTYLFLLCLTFQAKASENNVNIRYDGIYLSHPDLAQINMVYKDYKYRDFMYMPDWKYPPIFLEQMPIDFSKITDSQQRNKLFLQILVPLALKLRQEILLERLDVEDLIKEFNTYHDISDEQIKIIEEKAEKYDIFTPFKGERRYALLLQKLKEKVDIIPPSMLIAAAAIESNWGTNRPVQQANSLYRELVWYSDEGLEPLDEQEDKTYRYKIFPTLYESMRSYALKINSNVNYEQFRIERAMLRAKEKNLLGRNMAYSMFLDSNLKNFAGILDYTITFYDLVNIDNAELAPLSLPEQ